MTIQRNVKFNMIYNLCKLERCNLTLTEITDYMMDYELDFIIDEHESNIINNLNNGINFINGSESEFSLCFITKLHSLVGYNEALEWGYLRNGDVGISGVEYKPIIPIEKEVISYLNKLLNIKDPYERSITYMLWAMRSQLFWDCNKRTSILCANKILLLSNVGYYIMIEEGLLSEFHVLLSNFYETNDMSVISVFLYENCLYKF